MSITSVKAVSISWDSWDPSDDHFSRMPRKHWSIPSYQVVSITATVFYGAKKNSARRLQSVLKAAARLISNKRKFDHITPVLRDHFHWLPIRQSINFKIAVIVYNALYGRGPTYLSCAPALSPGLSGRLAPRLTCDLLFEATWLCLELGPVASVLDVSVSPDRLFGTHCPRTFEFRNCRWNV